MLSKKVDGEPVNTAETAMELFEKLRDSDGFEMVVNRNGQETTRKLYGGLGFTVKGHYDIIRDDFCSFTLFFLFFSATSGGGAGRAFKGFGQSNTENRQTGSRV